jgi:hypothetical protein
LIEAGNNMILDGPGQGHVMRRNYQFHTGEDAGLFREKPVKVYLFKAVRAESFLLGLQFEYPERR